MTSLAEKNECRERAKELMRMLDMKTGTVAAMLELVEAGVDFRYRNYKGAQCMTLAADQGDITLVKALAEKGAPLDFIDGGGNTPLTIASYWNRHDVVRLLLEKGANADMANNDGNTALMRAAFTGGLETVDVLLAAGASTRLTQGKEWSDFRAVGLFIDVCDRIMAEEQRRKAEKARAIKDATMLQSAVKPLKRLTVKPRH